MAKSRKITLEEYKKNPQAEKKNVKGYKPYKPTKRAKTSRKTDLDAQLDKLSKIANTRLSALENAKMRTGAYQSIEKRALQGSSFMNIDKKGHPRFKRGTVNLKPQQKKAMLEALNKFLYEDKTSTIKGNREKYDKAQDKFEHKLGHNLTKEQYNTVIKWINEITKKTNYGSEKVMDMVSKGLDGGVTFEDIEELVKGSSANNYADFEDIFDLLTNTISLDDIASETDSTGGMWGSATDWDNIF